MDFIKWALFECLEQHSSFGLFLFGMSNWVLVVCLTLFLLLAAWAIWGPQVLLIPLAATYFWAYKVYKKEKKDGST